VLHGDLQVLYYDLSDLYTLTLQVKEDIEFQMGLFVKLSSGKWLFVKPSSGKFLSLEN
jgi:hypothetical protein